MKRLTDESYAKIRQIADEVEKVIVGKRDAVKLLIIALLSGGHVLIEDVPGVGKTTMATALGKAMGLVCKRAQFTPDVMASDITGFTMYNKRTDGFEYKQGLVMCNIFLADEINRTSPKTQSALLEAMEEQTVTVDSKTHPLPKPFMVIATQNEVGYVGTYPLPEAQLDRFLMKISMGYPTFEQEIDIIAGRQTENPLSEITPICSKEEINDIIEGVREVNIERGIYYYIVQMVSATRTHKSVMLGASPRASLSLMRASQSCAFVSGRAYVIPEDVLKMTPHVLSHRLLLTQEAKIHKITELNVLKDIAKSITPPYSRDAAKEESARYGRARVIRE
ncbi:MAG: MoxR family ATPase [Oscillospiraceae bacterium]|jgi:MoxR-like ATPase|nr:MoxR family ATPase [Oscillospiraceae bacterium]